MQKLNGILWLKNWLLFIFPIEQKLFKELQETKCNSLNLSALGQEIHHLCWKSERNPNAVTVTFTGHSKWMMLWGKISPCKTACSFHIYFDLSKYPRMKKKLCWKIAPLKRETVFEIKHSYVIWKKVVAEGLTFWKHFRANNMLWGTAVGWPHK